MTQYAMDPAGIVLVASAAALVLGLLARTVGLPPAIGYVLAGVAVGQHTPGPVVDPEGAAKLTAIIAPLLMLHLGWSLGRPQDAGALLRSIPAALIPLAIAGGAGWAVGRLLGLDGGAAFAFALVIAAAGGSLAALGNGPRDRAPLGLAMATPAIVLAGAGLLLPVATEGLSALPRSAAAWAAIFLSLRILGPGLFAVLDRDAPELKAFAVPLLGLGSAIAAAGLAGLPLPVGAFAAGLALARIQGAAEARPMGMDALRAAPRIALLVCVGVLLDPAVLVEQSATLACAVGAALLGPGLATRLAGGASDGHAPAAAAPGATSARVEVALTVACVGASVELLAGPAWDLAIGAALLAFVLLSLLGEHEAAGTRGT
jgi:CPA2 family monovalent cation:H+ antiporter-2